MRRLVLRVEDLEVDDIFVVGYVGFVSVLGLSVGLSWGLISPLVPRGGL